MRDQIRSYTKQPIPEMYLKPLKSTTPEAKRIAAKIPAAYSLLATKD
jgi:hypothetical protein